MFRNRRRPRRWRTELGSIRCERAALRSNQFVAARARSVRQTSRPEDRSCRRAWFARRERRRSAHPTSNRAGGRVSDVAGHTEIARLSHREVDASASIGEPCGQLVAEALGGRSREADRQQVDIGGSRRGTSGHDRSVRIQGGARIHLCDQLDRGGVNRPKVGGDVVETHPRSDRTAWSHPFQRVRHAAPRAESARLRSANSVRPSIRRVRAFRPSEKGSAAP